MRYSMLLLLIFLTACGEDFVYSAEKEIPAAQWTYADSLDFAIPIADTSRIYNLYLDLDHSVDYAYQNIYLKIATEYPSGKRTEELLPLDLADKTGQWYGNCGGEECEVRVNLQQRAFFNEIGTHRIIFKQYLRESPLRGIQKLALHVEIAERN